MKDIYFEWANLEKQREEGAHKEFIISSTCPNRVHLAIVNKRRTIYIEFNDINKAKPCFQRLKGLNVIPTKEKSIDPLKDCLKIEDDFDAPDIFMFFSNSLASNLLDSKNENDTAFIIKKTIDIFKDYFKNKFPTLSKQEEQGIFGELLYLKKVLIVKGEEAIFSWTGPEKNKRDFVFDNVKSVEIKTTLKQIDPHISISNELQLDYSYPKDLDSLYLKVFILEEVEVGNSIKDIASEIYSLIKSRTIRDVFFAKLFEDKVDLKNFEPKCKFSVQDEITYEINFKFPAITKDVLPKGIFDVKYKIKLSEIKNFEINEDIL